MFSTVLSHLKCSDEELFEMAAFAISLINFEFLASETFSKQANNLAFSIFLFHNKFCHFSSFETRFCFYILAEQTTACSLNLEYTFRMGKKTTPIKIVGAFLLK